MKTHLAVTSPDGVTSACGRGARIDTSTFRVDCGSCIIRNVFQELHQKAVIAKREAFLLIEPREFLEPWQKEPITMVCDECLGTKFRMGDRTCYGHYQNYTCAECGHNNSRITETGMCF